MIWLPQIPDERGWADSIRDLIRSPACPAQLARGESSDENEAYTRVPSCVLGYITCFYFASGGKLGSPGDRTASTCVVEKVTMAAPASSKRRSADDTLYIHQLHLRRPLQWLDAEFSKFCGG